MAKDLPPRTETVAYCEMDPGQAALYREVLDESRRKVFESIDKLGFGRSRVSILAALMKLLNQCARAMRQGASAAVAAEAVATLASLLQPFAPHLAAEVYYQLTAERVWTVPWPVADASLLTTPAVEIACQINGKLRDTLVMPKGTARDVLEAAALASDKIVRALEGKTPRKVIVVPDRLVNLVA